MALAEKHTKSVIECSFFDLCVTLGFERALDKLLFAVRKHFARTPPLTTKHVFVGTSRSELSWGRYPSV